MSNAGKTRLFYQNLWQSISTEVDVFYRDSHGKQYSYLDLKENILKCCKFLEQHQQKKIAVLCDKNFYNYCMILGILFSKNIWIPLSKSTPFQRNLKILENLDADILVTDYSSSNFFSEKLTIQKISLIAPDKIFTKTLDLDEKPKFANKPKDLSMIYFTSGSTGVPKGVMIKNESFINNIENILSILKPSKMRFIDLHDLSFVISIPIIFPCILSKSQIFSANSDIDVLFPGSVILREKINMLITVPSTLKRITVEKHSKKAINALKCVISCGEPLSYSLLSLFLVNNQLNFYNFYGSTEVAPWVFYHKCNHSTLSYSTKKNTVPLGTLLPGNEMAVTEDGMLLIKGVQVTEGYVGQKAYDHLIKYDGSFWLPMHDAVEEIDGIYFCHGRVDGVVKVKGFRIHLSDVEFNLKKINGVQECVCFANGEKITAFVYSQILSETDEIFKKAAEFLPNHMLPSRIVLGKQIPINKNGKIDRARIKHEFTG